MDTLHHPEPPDLALEIEYFVKRKCTPNWSIIPSVIDFIDITYIVDGMAEYTVDGVKYLASTGDVLCLPVGSHRRATSFPDSLMTGYCTNFRAYDIAGGQFALPFPLMAHIGMCPDVVEHFRALTHILIRREPGYRLKSNALLMLIIHRLYELVVCRADSDKMDPRIKRAVLFIDNHYQQPITVREMAASCGLNPVYFGALFKQNVGQSAKQYLTGIRISQAENMLRSGEYTVNDVAEQCGYEDVLYFSKHFKAVTGFSPSYFLPKWIEGEE